MKLTNTILHTVHDVLVHDPESRNNDMRLAVRVWQVLHAHRVIATTDHNGKTTNCFSLEDIATILAPYETVRRSRQTIQNTLGLYPCDKKVKGRRRQSEETMQQWVQNKLTPAQTKKILAEYLNTK